MDIPVKLQELEQKLQELAQQRAEAQALLTRITDQSIFLSGQHALLTEMQKAETTSESQKPNILNDG